MHNSFENIVEVPCGNINMMQTLKVKTNQAELSCVTFSRPGVVKFQLYLK